MRSTQFDDHSLSEEEPEQHRGRNRPEILCEETKHLGYAQNILVRLCRETFDFVSDPVGVGDDLVLWTHGNRNTSTQVLQLQSWQGVDVAKAKRKTNPRIHSITG
jgi:hypothetical protein